MTVTQTNPEKIAKQLKIVFDGLEELNTEKIEKEILEAKDELQNIIDELIVYEEKELQEIEKKNEIVVQHHRRSKKENYEVEEKKIPKMEMDSKLKDRLSYFIPLFILVGGIVLLWLLFYNFM